MVAAETFRKWEHRIIEGDVEGVLKEVVAQSPQWHELGKARLRCRQEALSHLARLNDWERQRRKGLMEYDEFSVKLAQLRQQTLELIHAIEAKDLGALEGGVAEIPAGNNDMMDRAFKGLLLAVFAISFFLIVRAVGFAGEAEFDERLFQLSVSSVGCGGGLFGYFRWRTVELKSQKPQS